MEPTRDRAKKKNNTSGGYLWQHWGERGGGLSSIPQHVLKSPDCIALNHAAFRMLFALISQFNGKNNGDLSAAKSVIGKYGFNSDDTISRCVIQLMSHGLIVRTRAGYAGSNGRRLCSLYGVTWLPIDEINDKENGEWIPKVRGTRNALRTDFSCLHDPEYKLYEAA